MWPRGCAGPSALDRLTGAGPALRQHVSGQARAGQGGSHDTPTVVAAHAARGRRRHARHEETAILTRAPSHAAAVRRRGPQPRTVLVIASMGAGMAFVDATIVNIAFPDIARSYPDASIASLSWVLNAYNIVFAAFLVAAGRLAHLIWPGAGFVSRPPPLTSGAGLCAGGPARRLPGSLRRPHAPR